MDLPAVKAGIELCEFGTHFGVKGMTGSFNVVHNMTNASVSLLSSIWKSTTEFMGVVQIEQPEYSRGADADLDKKKLRNVTAAHVRAITNYVDNVNRDTGQVRFPVLPHGGNSRHLPCFDKVNSIYEPGDKIVEDRSPPHCCPMR